MMSTHAHLNQTATRLAVMRPATATAASAKPAPFVRPHVSDSYPADVLPRRSFRVFGEFVAWGGNESSPLCEKPIEAMKQTTRAYRPPAMATHARFSTAGRKGCAQAATVDQERRVPVGAVGDSGWDPRSSTSHNEAGAVPVRRSAGSHDHPLTPRRRSRCH